MSRWMTVGVVACALGLTAACGGSDDGSDRPGSPTVYERIDNMTSCAELQAEFDTAMANFDRVEKGTAQAKTSLAYADAAEDRRQELGC